jgi:uncharacterized protein
MKGDVYDRLTACTGFDWDEGNRGKSADRHAVTAGEAEQPVFRQPFLVAYDTAHSQTEERFWALGQSASGRRLFLVFTLRDNRIRVISARDMNRRERGIYEKAQQAIQDR